jgi:hypothetical protein
MCAVEPQLGHGARGRGRGARAGLRRGRGRVPARARLRAHAARRARAGRHAARALPRLLRRDRPGTYPALTPAPGWSSGLSSRLQNQRSR